MRVQYQRRGAAYIGYRAVVRFGKADEALAGLQALGSDQIDPINFETHHHARQQTESRRHLVILNSGQSRIRDVTFGAQLCQ